jgi:hypothetical protein
MRAEEGRKRPDATSTLDAQFFLAQFFLKSIFVTRSFAGCARGEGIALAPALIEERVLRQVV